MNETTETFISFFLTNRQKVLFKRWTRPKSKIQAQQQKKMKKPLKAGVVPPHARVAVAPHARTTDLHHGVLAVPLEVFQSHDLVPHGVVEAEVTVATAEIADDLVPHAAAPGATVGTGGTGIVTMTDATTTIAIDMTAHVVAEAGAVRCVATTNAATAPVRTVVTAMAMEAFHSPSSAEATTGATVTTTDTTGGVAGIDTAAVAVEEGIAQTNRAVTSRWGGALAETRASTATTTTTAIAATELLGMSIILV